MKEVFACGVKMFGIKFVVTTIEEARTWESKDPEWNYYEKLEVRTLELI
jgi:hypothetical protein